MDLEPFSEDHQSSLHKLNQENELERLHQSKSLKHAELGSNSSSNYTDF